jgi:hypothetical protein
MNQYTANKPVRRLDEVQRDSGQLSLIPECIPVFRPSGQLKLFKFDPIEFSPLCCIRTPCLEYYE